MSIALAVLKESNEFLNILFDNITSAVFIVDNNFRVQNFNKSFEILFGRKQDELIGQLCGEVIGCVYTKTELMACGTTSNCHNCNLRKATQQSLYEQKFVSKEILIRDIDINGIIQKKYFQYTTRSIDYNSTHFVMLIVDDITESETQKALLDVKNKEITESLEYASNLQNTVLPSKDLLKQVFQNYFLLFQPREQVSGDFYWVLQKNNIRYFAIADCTGHGVPGAFMSIMGITYLNEITKVAGVTEVNEILNLLRAKIIESLKQKGISGEHKDGMDIALCSYNPETKDLQFSGANNTCLIVRCHPLMENSNPRSCLIELAPDKMPIAIHEVMTPFNKKTEHLIPGDTVYLMSDGFVDQFGGEKGKKFKSKQLKDLLLKSCTLSLNEQEVLLQQTLNKWMFHYGEYSQTDDITLLGIRF